MFKRLSFIFGVVIQSTSPSISLVACPEKNWLEDGLRSSRRVANQPHWKRPGVTMTSTTEDFIPLYDCGRTSYHPGLDYCLIC